MNFVVAAIKPWNKIAFDRRSRRLPGKWHLIERPEDLNASTLALVQPRYVFFPHWSWKVPNDVVNEYECVCFHMTDVPYGRGGSPLQNLIVQGHKDTKITALRMASEMDAGPVYMKRPLSLEGRAEEIFGRAAELVWDIIEQLIATQPTPVPQEGEPTFFKRRTPVESAVPVDGDLSKLFDFIRMLDAETYPKAFLEIGGLRLEFDNVAHEGSTLTARVVVSAKDAVAK